MSIFSITSLRTNRRGFTLVELLVVIAIISVLAGLLVVGVSAARDQARRLQCTNNQANVVKAMLAYTATNNELPGLVGTKFGKEMSWAVFLLPNLEENSFYKLYLDGGAISPAKISVFVCPSDIDKREGPVNSYVVNCGEENEDFDSAVHSTHLTCGIFYDKRVGGKSVKLDDIKSGLGNVILITENLQATAWFSSPVQEPSTLTAPQCWYYESDTAFTPPSGRQSRTGGAVGDIGFRWSADGDQTLKINANRKPDIANPEGMYRFARPSSNHTGVVIAAYADGHVATVNDDIDPEVYLKMCEPETSSGHDHHHP